MVAVLTAGALAGWAGGAAADTVFLQPGADTTLIETAPDANLGGAEYFNAGTTGSGSRNRALLWFDVASQVPLGALIESVTLTLDVVREPAMGAESTVFGLHRINRSWGEGVQVAPEGGSPGLGSPAVTGEATWRFRFVDGAAWTQPGGEPGVDFESAASGAALVFALGEPMTFESSDALVSDVQRWVNDPDRNFGWTLMTESEDVRHSARSFASRENGNGGPRLAVQFTVVPEPGTVTILTAGLGWLLWRGWRQGERRGRCRSQGQGPSVG